MKRTELQKEKEKVIIMMIQVENLLSCSENNESKAFLQNRLSSCYYELKRQLHNLNHVEVDNTEDSV